MSITPIDPTYRILTVDTILPNGATVLACHKTHERVPGDTYATWTALCARLFDNTPHPYVVWTVVARPDGFLAGHGHYFRTYNEAEAQYQEMGGK